MTTDIDPVIEAANAIKDKTLKANALALVERMTFRLEDGDDTDSGYTPEFLRLIQGITAQDSYPDSARAGDFVLGSGKEAFVLPKNSDLLPVMLPSSRIFWDPAEKDKGKMLCSSPDGVMGKLGACKTCQHAVYVDGVGVDCTAIITLTAMTADLSHIFRFGFSKTSWKVGSKLKSEMKRAAKQPFQTMVRLSSAVNQDHKQVQAPVVGLVGTPPADIQEFTRQVFLYFKKGRDAYIDVFRAALPAPSPVSGMLSAPGGTAAVVTDAALTSPLASEYKF